MSQNKSKLVSEGLLERLKGLKDVSESNISVRLVDPLLEELGWPLRSPVGNKSVENSYKIGDRGEYSYVLVEDDKPKIILDIREDLKINKKKRKVLKEVNDCILLVTDGYQYRMYLNDGKNIREVYSFKLRNINNRDKTVELINFDSVSSGLIDDVTRNYRKMYRDKRSLESGKEDIVEKLSEVALSNTEAIPKDVSVDGAERMTKFISRRIDRITLDSIIEMSINRPDYSGVKLSALDDGETIITKGSSEELDNRREERTSIGELVTSQERNPKYIAFYLEESSRVEYISEVEKFDLKHEKSEDEFANKVYNVEISRIREISDKISDEDGLFENIKYTEMSELIDCEDLSEIVE